MGPSEMTIPAGTHRRSALPPYAKASGGLRPAFAIRLRPACAKATAGRQGYGGQAASGGLRRGDTSILFVFLTLMVFVSGAIVIAVLSITSLRSVRDIVASTRAFAGADTGIERALNAYNWDTDGEESPDLQTCIDVRDEQVDGRPREEVRYDARVEGRDASGNDVACPSPDNVANGTAALCMTSRGKARNEEVQRLVTNNFIPPGAPTDPCE